MKYLLSKLQECEFEKLVGIQMSEIFFGSKNAEMVGTLLIKKIADCKVAYVKMKRRG
jgi:hypothetical protein